MGAEKGIVLEGFNWNLYGEGKWNKIWCIWEGRYCIWAAFCSQKVELKVWTTLNDRNIMSFTIKQYRNDEEKHSSYTYIYPNKKRVRWSWNTLPLNLLCHSNLKKKGWTDVVFKPTNSVDDWIIFILSLQIHDSSIPVA